MAFTTNFDRSSAKPVICTHDSSITKAHANRAFAVMLDDSASGLNEGPVITLLSGENAKVRGELIDVFDDGTCTALFDGIMYFRTGATYAVANNGKAVVGTTTPGIPGIANASNTQPGDPLIEGHFTKAEGANDIGVLRTRR